jgi:lipoyl(octanoyl) transferase
VDILDLSASSRLVDYHDAWDLQRAIHAEVVAGTRPDTLILVEHSGVYTAGKRTASRERPTDDTPVVDVDRGGHITWHGPGQLVGYPIVRLGEPVDVITYVRALEQATIDLCASLGLDAVRIDGRSGVWFSATEAQRARKVCAIGVRVAKGVTMHGFALNCNPDLGEFGRIIPCGLDDADVTSLSAELGREVTISEVRDATVGFLERSLADVVWGSATASDAAVRSTTAKEST